MSQPKWFQKFFYKETVLAIKSSLDFLSFESFRNDLIRLLPQESEKSRIRIANNILYRFFPDKRMYGFLPQIWEIYKDEILLREVLRYELLSKEPVITEFLLDYIIQAQDNSPLSSQIFDKYIKKVYGKEIKNLVWWLQGCLRDLGFISKSELGWKINDISVPETAFLLLLHKILVPFPAKLEFNQITEANFWKLVGIKEVEKLKEILFKASINNLVDFDGRILTTKHSFEHFMSIYHTY